MAKNRRTKSDRRKDIWKKTNGLCAHCGKEVSSTSQTVDHIIPKSMGGGDDQRNLMPLCKRCNGSRENNKIELDTFYGFAQSWAISDAESYIFEWKMSRTNQSGEMFLEKSKKWVF